MADEIKGRHGGRDVRVTWLLVQHADSDPDFQRYCLALMYEARSDVDIQNIAYLEDRVRVNDGRPQLYGTQFTIDDAGNLAPLPIDDPEIVDSRRKKVGLPPLAEYEEDLRRSQRLHRKE